jgi:DNA-binding CsgD family transcriptional regulator
MPSVVQSEVLVLSSNSVIAEALVAALRQSGWDVGRFVPERDVRIGQYARVVVGPIDPHSEEASVLATLVGASTVVLGDHVVVRGATVLGPSAGLIAVSSALNLHPRTPRRVALTIRHAEILQYVADGMSVAEAAVKLGITAKTVNNHLGSVYRRLGVDNLTQAVLKAIRMGFVDPSGQVVEPARAG